MAENLVEKYHSITFDKDDDKNSYNTFSSFNLIPSERPYVETPEVKTTFIDIPGANGSLDYTEALVGGVTYKDRTGSWEFYVQNNWGSDPNSAWAQRLSNILGCLHGQYFEKITLVDEPDYYYTGRVWVKWKTGTDYSKVTIEYQLDPYKTPIQTEHVRDWLWDELFDNEIRYGTYEVQGTKNRTILGTSGGKVYFLTDSLMHVKIHDDGYEFNIPANTPTEYTLPYSRLTFTITGVGKVEMTYDTPKIL
ncbi:MAG: hypothetical protein J6Y02_00790 [Pseudobutyrivibrio sp.]|nr:hypothetical protein [Pseudobutyrivibrio sp.]